MPRIKQQTTTTPPADPLIGAHESIAGGIETAFDRAKRAGCRTLQAFTKNSNQWRAKPLSDEAIAKYKTAASKSTIRPVVAHDSYLINLCATDLSILEKSREAFIDELQRCNALAIPYLNFHPGAHMGAGEEEGITKIVDSLNRAHEATPGFKVMSILETTAGAGSAHSRGVVRFRANTWEVGESTPRWGWLGTSPI